MSNMSREEAIRVLTEHGLNSNSLKSTVRVWLRGAYNHPSMTDKPTVKAALTLAKELGLTRYGNDKKF